MTPSPPNCSGPLCTHPAAVDGLCTAHYAQRRRHPRRQLRPLRSGTVQVSLRVSVELKRAVGRRAARDGVDPSEVWRRAAAEFLK